MTAGHVSVFEAVEFLHKNRRKIKGFEVDTEWAETGDIKVTLNDGTVVDIYSGDRYDPVKYMVTPAYKGDGSADYEPVFGGVEVLKRRVDELEKAIRDFLEDDPTAIEPLYEVMEGKDCG